ncbi:MAG TPA: HD-GYP domain-containing protein, partial [Acidimicrobiales bacterium]|nr:HD-GYP domain-containing protein [Acidimicrobiales bacterium]
MAKAPGGIPGSPPLLDIGPTMYRRAPTAARTPGRHRPVSSKQAGPGVHRRPRPLHARRGPVGWTPPSWLTDQHPPHGSAHGAPSNESGTAEAGWCRRPVLSALVRSVVLAISLATATLAAVVATRLLPRTSTGAASLLWWLAVVAISTVVMLGIHRLARRLLPLAQLLNLAIVFPDKAPDRMQMAFRAGTLRHLEQRLAHARDHGIDDEPTKAAATILTLVAAISAHDRRTRGHSERVRAFNDLLAEELRLPPHDRERLRWAALLHDVGKLHTPPRILNKPGPLTPEEWKVLHRHPEDGARITASLRDWLGLWADAIEQHHERWDGSGYPKGLSGTEISLGGPHLAVADAYEVMTSPRPYQRAKSSRTAREEFACCASGSQFDPMVVRAFLTASLGRMRRIVGPVAWLAQLPLLLSGPKLATALAATGRQVAATAGAATAVGVLTVSGTIQTPSPPAVDPAARAPVASRPEPT